MGFKSWFLQVSSGILTVCRVYLWLCGYSLSWVTLIYLPHLHIEEGWFVSGTILNLVLFMNVGGGMLFVHIFLWTGIFSCPFLYPISSETQLTIILFLEQFSFLWKSPDHNFGIFRGRFLDEKSSWISRTGENPPSWTGRLIHILLSLILFIFISSLVLILLSIKRN